MSRKMRRRCLDVLTVVVATCLFMGRSAVAIRGDTDTLPVRGAGSGKGSLRGFPEQVKGHVIEVPSNFGYPLGVTRGEITGVDTSENQAVMVKVNSRLPRAILDKEIARMSQPETEQLNSLENNYENEAQRMVSVEESVSPMKLKLDTALNRIDTLEAKLAASKASSAAEVMALERVVQRLEPKLQSAETRLKKEDDKMRALVTKLAPSLDSLTEKQRTSEIRTDEVALEQDKLFKQASLIKTDIEALGKIHRRNSENLQRASAKQSDALRKAVDEADERNKAEREAMKKTFRTFKSDTKAALKEIHLKNEAQDSELLSLEGDIGRLEVADEALEKASEQANDLLKKNMVRALDKSVQKAADDAAEALAASMKEAKAETSANLAEAEAKAKKMRAEMQKRFNASIETAVAASDAKAAAQLKELRDQGEEAVLRLESANDAMKDEAARTKEVLEKKIKDVEQNADEKATAQLEALKANMESKITKVESAAAAEIKKLQEADVEQAERLRNQERAVKSTQEAVAANARQLKGNAADIEALKQADAEAMKKFNAFEEDTAKELKQIHLADAAQQQRLESVDDDLKNLAKQDEKFQAEAIAAHATAMKEIKSTSKGLRTEIAQTKASLVSSIEMVRGANKKDLEQQKQNMQAKFDQTIQDAVAASDQKAADALEQLREDGLDAMARMEAKHDRLEKVVKRTKDHLEKEIGNAKKSLSKDIANAKAEAKEAVQQASRAQSAKLDSMRDAMETQIGALEAADKAQAMRMDLAEQKMDDNSKDLSVVQISIDDLQASDAEMASQIASNAGASEILKETDELIDGKQKTAEEKIERMSSTLKQAVPLIKLAEDKKGLLKSLQFDIDELKRSNLEQKDIAKEASGFLAKRLAVLQTPDKELVAVINSAKASIGRALTKMATDGAGETAKALAAMKGDMKVAIVACEGQSKHTMASALKLLKNDVMEQWKKIEDGNKALTEMADKTASAVEKKIAQARDGVTDATALASLDTLKSQLVARIRELMKCCFPDTVVDAKASFAEKSVAVVAEADGPVNLAEKAEDDKAEMEKAAEEIRESFHSF